LLKGQKVFFSLFFLLLLCLMFLSADTDQSKKAYELMYDDLQALKVQVQELSALLKKNSSDLQELREQVKVLGDLIRRNQAEQNSLKDELKNIPVQFQMFSSKLEEIQFEISAWQDILDTLKNLTAQPKPEEKTPAKGAKPAATKKEQPLAETQKQAMVTIPAQEMYNNAYGDYLKGNYELAIDSFRLFLQRYPNTLLSDNALYWIGECYYSQGKYDEAIESFNDLLLSYPAGDKIPAAYLKKGMSLMEQGKKEEALATFKLLVSKYPLQEEAKLAQQKINELVGK
jgi:tol-pal system protein YbgF